MSLHINSQTETVHINSNKQMNTQWNDNNIHLTKGHFQAIGKSRRLLWSRYSFVSPTAPWIPLGKLFSWLNDNVRTFSAVQPHVSPSASSPSSSSPNKEEILFRARFSFFIVGNWNKETGAHVSWLSKADSFCILLDKANVIFAFNEAFTRKKTCHCG